MVWVFEQTRWPSLIELVCKIVSLSRELAAEEPAHFPENLRQEGVLTGLTVEIYLPFRSDLSYCDSCNRNRSEELNKWQLLSLCFINCAQVFLWFLLYVVKLLSNKFCPGAADLHHCIGHAQPLINPQVRNEWCFHCLRGLHRFLHHLLSLILCPGFTCLF